MPDASLRYVIVSKHGTTRSSRTEYIRGRNSRSEYRPQRPVIQNRDLGYVFQLDPESRVYTAFGAAYSIKSALIIGRVPGK